MGTGVLGIHRGTFSWFLFHVKPFGLKFLIPPPVTPMSPFQLPNGVKKGGGMRRGGRGNG